MIGWLISESYTSMWYFAVEAVELCSRVVGVNTARC